MAEWTKEEITPELRFRIVRAYGPNPLDLHISRILQQKWKVTVGGTGEGVTYRDEWRDVPIGNWENEK